MFWKKMAVHNLLNVYWDFPRTKSLIFSIEEISLANQKNKTQK